MLLEQYRSNLLINFFEKIPYKSCKLSGTHTHTLLFCRRGIHIFSAVHFSHIRTHFSVIYEKKRFFPYPLLLSYLLYFLRKIGTKEHTYHKIDAFCLSSQPTRKKEATTMAYMDMILIGMLNNNMNFDILSRNCVLFDYFVLFQLH